MKLQRRPDACWGKLSQPQNDAGEESNVVLWSPVERRLHILNATAAAVWGQLKTPTTIDDLIDAITARFRARRPIVARDVKVLLERLQTAELVCSSDVAAQFPPVAPIADYERPADRYPNHVGPTTIGPLCVLGCPMLIDADDRTLFQSLSSILAPLRDQTIDLTTGSVIHLAARSTDAGFDIERNGTRMMAVPSREFALRSLLAEVNAAPLAVQRSNVVLHAAGAAFGGSHADDSLVVFPGVSDSGKSTLVAQLITRGHSYLTDEAVAIDVNSLEAQTFHKAICVEPMGQTVLGELDYAASQPLISSTWDVDPRRVGLGRLAGAGRVSALVFPTYLPGEDTQLTPLEPLETLQRLIANAFDFGTVGQPAFAALVRLANTTRAYSLVHGGDGSQLTVLENMFGRPLTHAA